MKRRRFHCSFTRGGHFNSPFCLQCLAIMNYFRSIERTLTIDDGGLVYGEDGFKLKR